MVAESIFPKINGDILYASEVNRFAKSRVFLGIGSGILMSSGNTFRTAGSFVIPSGTFFRSCVLEIDYALGTAGSTTPDFVISGLAGNYAVSNGPNVSFSNNYTLGTGRATVNIAQSGTNWSHHMLLANINFTTSAGDGGGLYFGNVIGHAAINPGSVFVVFYGAHISANPATNGSKAYTFVNLNGYGQERTS